MLEDALAEALLANRFGTYQHHRFGPGTTLTDLYLDVVMPGVRWCVRSKSMPDGRYFPRVNTWRSAYGKMRRIQHGRYVTR